MSVCCFHSILYKTKNRQTSPKQQTPKPPTPIEIAAKKVAELMHKGKVKVYSIKELAEKTAREAREALKPRSIVDILPGTPKPTALLGKAIDTGSQNLTKVISKAEDVYVTASNKTADALKSVLPNWTDSIIDGVKDFADNIAGAIAGITEEIASIAIGISKFIFNTSEAIQGLKDVLVSFVKEIIPKFFGFIKDLVLNTKDAIGDTMEYIRGLALLSAFERGRKFAKDIVEVVSWLMVGAGVLGAAGKAAMHVAQKVGMMGVLEGVVSGVRAKMPNPKLTEPILSPSSAIVIKPNLPPNTGFNSFDAFKKTAGPAGGGREWHHVVEQNPSNVTQFGQQTLQNTDNLINITKAIHQRISSFYSSKTDFSGGQTIRQWISQQSFEAQRAYGNEILKKALKGDL